MNTHLADTMLVQAASRTLDMHEFVEQCTEEVNQEVVCGSAGRGRSLNYPLIRKVQVCLVTIKFDPLVNCWERRSEELASDTLMETPPLECSRVVLQEHTVD